MLDEKDLQAIAQLMAGLEQRMEQKLSQQKQEIAGEVQSLMAQQKQEITGEVKSLMAQQKLEIIGEMKVLLEAEVTPKFNLLADGLAAVNEKLKALPDPELMDKMQDELDLHHQMLKIHTDEIKRLKKAQ